jgi:N-acetylglucosamine malate deacetylase 2
LYHKQKGYRMIVLSIGAHPDDEIYAAGLLAKYAAEGHAVYILTTTRGEGGPTGDPPLTDRAGLPTLREAEGREAGRLLGAREVRYLPFVDPLPGPNRQWKAAEVPLETFSGAIAEVLAELRPDVVVTHGSGGEYGHPQHLFTHQAVFAALARLAPWRPAEVLTWEAAFPGADPERKLNPNDPADLVLDVSPWLEQKVAAAEAHQTQRLAILGNQPDKTIREVMDRIESYKHW